MGWDSILGYSIFLLVFLISTRASAFEIMIIPPNPSPTDEIFVTIYSPGNDSCNVSAEPPKFSLSGNELHIDFVPLEERVDCYFSESPWVITVPTRTRLPLGAYEVIVTRDNELKQSSFTVGNSFPVDIRQVVCKNRNSGKKVTIKTLNESEKILVDFGGCITNGLRVRAGQKIERSVIGIATTTSGNR